MTNPNDSAAVTFQAVDKFFGDLHVLAGIDLTIARGEKVVICGPSGCGKSTLLRCINRLETFQSGALRVNGRNFVPNKPGLFAPPSEVGMVFQNFNLFPHLSVLENCMLAPVTTGKLSRVQARETAMTYLTRVRIAEHADKYPSQISGGQQQRAAIARALCLHPRIMLLDEPTSALDPEMVKEVLDIIEMLAGDGMTMVMVTHEMGFARRVADRIVFMEQGRIIETLPPDIFFSDAANERSRAFVVKVLR